MNGVLYKSNSANIKIAGSQKVDTTYATIENSCPNDCPIKNNGCYASLGPINIIVRKLDNEAFKFTGLDVARAEAKAIDNSYGSGQVPEGRFLRLHSAGDSKTIKGSRLINSAVKRWKKRGGKENGVWSYTHAWKNVPRHVWKDVSMLASISSVKEVKAAQEQGYAPAIMVEEHLSDKTYILPNSSIKWIPCPAQTKEDVACTDCKLCMDADRLYKDGYGIAFAVHGAAKEKVKRHLKVVK